MCGAGLALVLLALVLLLGLLCSGVAKLWQCKDKGSGAEREVRCVYVCSMLSSIGPWNVCTAPACPYARSSVRCTV